MQTVTLHADDFKTIHNTLCELRGLAQRMEQSMIKIEEVERIIESFESGLADAYGQDEASFDLKMDYFRDYQDQHEFRSIWSLFELDVGCFALPHPYLSDSFVVYGKGHVPVLGPTWGDVYRAADSAIRNSGDTHHCFIEGFEVKGNQLHMYTGS
jgi:hypothetical protein